MKLISPDAFHQIPTGKWIYGLFEIFRLKVNPFLYSRFAITIKLKNKIVLFINPRWDEGRTVFNSMDERGWHDEESNFFSTLYPECEFTIKILFSENGYEVGDLFLFFTFPSNHPKMNHSLSDRS